jgi:hypothetical protein
MSQKLPSDFNIRTASFWWQGTKLTRTNEGANKCSKKSRIHLKILGSKKLTWNEFRTHWESMYIQRLRTEFRRHEDLAPMNCAPILKLNIFPFCSDRFPWYYKAFRSNHLAAHVSKEINQYKNSHIDVTLKENSLVDVNQNWKPCCYWTLGL